MKQWQSMYFKLTLVQNERKWVSSKYKFWIFGGIMNDSWKKTLVQKTRNEKDISPKCNPSKGQAKVHGYKVVQNTASRESSAEYKIFS